MTIFNHTNQIKRTDSDQNDVAIQCACQIIAAWCANNKCNIDDIQSHLNRVHDYIVDTMRNTINGVTNSNTETVHPDYIICLEDGTKLKTLKRHLSSKYGMTIEEYKRKWNLDYNYPTIAPNYRLKRSEIAKKIIHTKRAA